METVQFISTSPTELVKLIDKAVEHRFEDLKKSFQPKFPTEYLTRQETAELLKVDVSSIHNWTKKKILTSYGCSGRVYYKRQEIEAAIVQLKQ